MRRVFEIVLGILILVVAITVLGWIGYAYTVRPEQPDYPWWWAVLLVIMWVYAISVGIRRVRGGERAKGREHVDT